MRPSLPSAPTGRAKNRREPWPRWQLFYYLLVAFDIFAVSLCLHWNHRITNVYQQSIEANQMWEQRLTSYTKLSELAAAVNAPGNDAFDSPNVPAEAARMRAAARTFHSRLAQHQRELRADENATAAPLLRDFAAIDTAMREMGSEGEQIFALFERGQRDKAGARMATMDRKYREVNRALTRLRDDVSAIQTRLLTQQATVADWMETIQCAMVALIFVMVGGAAAYGRRLARQMEVVAQERERSIRELAVLDERNRIARDIHDALAQNFTGIITHLEAAGVVLPPNSQGGQFLAQARHLARDGLQEARRSVRALRSPRLDGGLPDALNTVLHDLTSASPVKANLCVRGTPRPLDAEAETHLLRIGQEALTNALRHAEATTIEVELLFEPHNVRLCVRDDGQGFDGEQNGYGFGLVSMGERARSLGATLAIESRPGHGTEVRVTMSQPVAE